jgi:hypothetical protein
VGNEAHNDNNNLDGENAVNANSKTIWWHHKWLQKAVGESLFSNYDSIMGYAGKHNIPVTLPFVKRLLNERPDLYKIDKSHRQHTIQLVAEIRLMSSRFFPDEILDDHGNVIGSRAAQA